MLLNTAFAVLAILAGLVTLAVMVVAIAYTVLVRRLAIKMRRTLANLEGGLRAKMEEARLNALSGESMVSGGALDVVPPMEIRLLPSARRLHCETELGRRIDTWLIEHGFKRVANFEIHELDGEQLCTYLSEDGQLVAAIRQMSGQGDPFVEFCFDLTVGEGPALRGGVSNPPTGTLQVSEDGCGKHFCGSIGENFSLLPQMWLEAKDLLDQHFVRQVSAAFMAQFYEDAHAAEMQFRITSGGLTEIEVRRSFAEQGIEASEDDVYQVVERWQIFIRQRLLSLSRRVSQWVGRGQRVLVVYDGIDKRFLLADMRELFADFSRQDPVEGQRMLEEFQLLLGEFSVRDAVARLRPLLPRKLQYHLIDRIDRPSEADFYLLPVPEDG